MHNGKKKTPGGKLRMNKLYASESKLLTAELQEMVNGQSDEENLSE